MSRSYKKAILKADGSKKWAKRMAAKAVRRRDEMDNGGAYKKAYCSYDINDWVFYECFEPETHFVIDWKLGEFVEKATYITKHPGVKKTKTGWIIPK